MKVLNEASVAHVSGGSLINPQSPLEWAMWMKRVSRLALFM